MTEYALLTLGQLHQLLAPAVSPLLQQDGFVEAGTLKWVRSADAPIRQVFAFLQWKGGVVAPSWGLSLDFVPHVSGGRLRWHRTPKAAMMDLRVDSRDRALDLPYHRGAEPVRLGAARVVQAAVAQAREFWEQCRSEPELLPAFRRVANYYAAHSGLDFYAFVQHPLALAVLHARRQQKAAAMDELSRYHEYGKGDEDLDLALRRLVDGSSAA